MDLWFRCLTEHSRLRSHWSLCPDTGPLYLNNYIIPVLSRRKGMKLGLYNNEQGCSPSEKRVPTENVWLKVRLRRMSGYSHQTLYQQTNLHSRLARHWRNSARCYVLIVDMRIALTVGNHEAAGLCDSAMLCVQHVDICSEPRWKSR